MANARCTAFTLAPAVIASEAAGCLSSWVPARTWTAVAGVAVLCAGDAVTDGLVSPAHSRWGDVCVAHPRVTLSLRMRNQGRAMSVAIRSMSSRPHVTRLRWPASSGGETVGTANRPRSSQEPGAVLLAPLGRGLEPGGRVHSSVTDLGGVDRDTTPNPRKVSGKDGGGIPTPSGMYRRPRVRVRNDYLYGNTKCPREGRG